MEPSILTSLKDWQGFLGTLLGVIIGGGLSLIGMRFQQKNQRLGDFEKRQVGNLESIHEHLTAIADEAALTEARIIGKIGVDLPFDSNSFGAKLPIDKLQMLVDFYAPDLKPEVAIIREQFMKLAEAAIAAIFTSEAERRDKGGLILLAHKNTLEIRAQAEIAKGKLVNSVKLYQPKSNSR